MASGDGLIVASRRLAIRGHRGSEAGGLPVLLHVVHYVPLEGLTSPEVPTVGVVVGVLHAGGGGGQEVPVMGLVTTLALAEPDPQAELGCCLPDGSFATLPAADCTAQGGSLALLGPLGDGDGDGDGIDDSCAYEYGTLTFLTITNTLTAEELEAFEQYEQVVCELAGVCTWGYIQPPLGGDGGAGGDGLDGEDSDGDDDGSDGEAAQGGQGGSGGSGAGNGSGGPSLEDCLDKYDECMAEASDRAVRCVRGAKLEKIACLATAAGVSIGAVVSCVGCAASAGLVTLACGACVAALLGLAGLAAKPCLDSYKEKVAECLDGFNRDRQICENSWYSMGCGKYGTAPR